MYKLHVIAPLGSLARDIQTEYGRVDADVPAHSSQLLRALPFILRRDRTQCFFSPPVQILLQFSLSDLFSIIIQNLNSSSSELHMYIV